MKITTSRGPDDVWIAIDDDTYDAESDSVGAWSNSPAGLGDTEIGAVRDLLDQIEEKENATGIRHGMRRHKEWLL